MLESEMEDLLIKQLTSGLSQWTYRPDLTTEEALWNNLREKLNRNNIDKLQGIPLTEGEMGQVKQFLLDQAATTYKLHVGCLVSIRSPRFRSTARMLR